MNFNHSEEQTMIKDGIARFVRDHYDFDTRRDIIASDEGINRDYWSTFAELGWLSIPFEEKYGGFGGSVEDTAIIAEELGKAIVVEPFVSTVVVFGGLLSASTNEQVKEEVIPSIIEGACLGTFAFTEQQSRYELTDIKTQATAKGDGYVINGEKTVVQNAASANKIIVSARTSGDQFDRIGISLFIVDADAPGITVKSYKTMDGQSAATVVFNDVAATQSQLLSDAGTGMDIIDQAMPHILLGLCAEALGIMEVLNTTTVEYTKTRKQFDLPISSFQVLQHRMVDTFMAYEQSKSMLYRGLCEANEYASENTDQAGLAKAVHALKAVVARNGKLIAEEAIQIHGGIGMTDELNVGHYVKRLMTINVAFGDGDYHQGKFSQLNYGG